jgi:release factor glutamine methyltransferase
VENRWNIKELLVWTTRYFSERGMDNPRLEAELLLAHTLGQDRVQLYADYDRPV